MIEPRQLEFRIDTDHMIDVIILDEIVAVSEIFAIANDLQGGDQSNSLALLAKVSVQLKIVRGLLSKIVWHEDHYLDPVDALPVVGLMTLRQILDTITGIMGQINVDGNAETDKADD